jgi:hypothetical protein
MADLSVSNFPNEVTTPANTDLLYISDDLGGGSFESKRITWANVVAAIGGGGDGNGIYDGSGSLSGATTVTMGVNSITWSGSGDFIVDVDTRLEEAHIGNNSATKVAVGTVDLNIYSTSGGFSAPSTISFWNNVGQRPSGIQGQGFYLKFGVAVDNTTTLYTHYIEGRTTTFNRMYGGSTSRIADVQGNTYNYAFGAISNSVSELGFVTFQYNTSTLSGSTHMRLRHNTGATAGTNNDVFELLGYHGNWAGGSNNYVANSVVFRPMNSSRVYHELNSTGITFSDSNGDQLVRIASNGVVEFEEFTVATLPSVVVGGYIMVTDETGGYVPAFSDGTNWRRVTDRAIVS